MNFDPVAKNRITFNQTCCATDFKLLYSEVRKVSILRECLLRTFRGQLPFFFPLRANVGRMMPFSLCLLGNIYLKYLQDKLLVFK
jgi:hypothetical protein